MVNTGYRPSERAKMSFTLKTALSVPSFTAVWRAVAATDLVGMIPCRLAERVAGPAGLAMYSMPFAPPRAELCQAWHRRNSTTRGLIWLRAQVAEIPAKLDDEANPEHGARCGLQRGLKA